MFGVLFLLFIWLRLKITYNSVEIMFTLIEHVAVERKTSHHKKKKKNDEIYNIYKFLQELRSQDRESKNEMQNLSEEKSTMFEQT